MPKPQTVHYRAEYADRLLAFFSRAPYRVITIEKFDRNGAVVGAKEEKVACEFPTFSRFAATMGVTLADLQEWRKNTRFDKAYKACEALQKSIAIENGMQGRYDTSFVKFFLSNECSEQTMASETFAVDIHVVDA